MKPYAPCPATARAQTQTHLARIHCELYKGHDGPHIHLDHGEWTNHTERARNGHYDHLFDYPELTDRDYNRHNGGNPA